MNSRTPDKLKQHQEVVLERVLHQATAELKKEFTSKSTKDPCVFLAREYPRGFFEDYCLLFSFFESLKDALSSRNRRAYTLVCDENSPR